MTTKSPTHEEISRRAQEIWSARGNPNGNDTTIWLEAERQLTVGSPEPRISVSIQPDPAPRAFGRNLSAATSGAARSVPVAAEPATDHLHASAAPTPDAIEIGAKAVSQKKAARAPRLPNKKNASQHAPTESGKPLWDKPHSS